MANMFEVQTVNPLQALLVGDQAYQGARKTAREEQQKSVLAQLLGGGGAMGGQPGQPGQAPDFNRAATALAASGDLDGATKIATLGKAFAPESSADIQAFKLAQGQGFKGGILDFMKEKAAAGATRVSNNTNVSSGEKAYDAAMGKELADLNVGIIKGASIARTSQANLDRLGQLLQEPGVYQGTAGEKILQLKKFAKSVGIDVGEVGGAEAVQSISNQLALQARNPAGGAGMPGSMSDSDRSYLKDMQPGLEKTPEGNRLIIDVNRKLNQRAIDVEKFRQDYIKKNGRLNEGFYSALSEWSNANPLFPQGAQRGPSVSPPQSQAAPRKAPDGNFYVPDPSRPGKYLQVVQ